MADLTWMSRSDLVIVWGIPHIQWGAGVRRLWVGLGA